MSNLIIPTNVILLFDESGTPTFNAGHEEQLFMGVAAVYRENDEDAILASCSKIIGIDKNAPKKYRMIGNSTAIQISDMLANLPIDLYCSYLDLTNPILKKVAHEYLKIGNNIRLNIRGKIEDNVRERKLSHLLYSQVQTHSTLNLLSDYIAVQSDKLLNIQVYLDYWQMPECDKSIVLTTTQNSLYESLNNLIAKMNWVGHISVKEIIYLDNSLSILTKRKRFIDAAASVMRRLLFQTFESKSDSEILKSFNNQNNKSILIIKDISSITIDFLSKFGDDLRKNGHL